jgi:dolichyl-phosphate-mannose-protein mannosyltransferase
VNEARNRAILAALLVATLVLTAAAWLRSAEYDEQYTLFVTGGMARPAWPAEALVAGDVRAAQAGHAGFVAIARDLRTTDVHPPLYFWLVAAWRAAVGDGLFAARLLSVLLSVVTLCGVAVIARTAAVPPAPAVLLTLGCYGFAYTGSIARGFALAQMLSVWGVALLLIAHRRRRPAVMLAAGLLLGSATFANYLAVFVACAALLYAVIADEARQSGAGWSVSFALPAWAGFAAWAPADLWFFLAQRQSRTGQFPRFHLLSGMARLGQYFAANVLGGLPLYVDGAARWVVMMALALLLATLAALTIGRWQHIATPPARLLLAMALGASPIGVAALGIVFDSTPIELRYLAFATPFVGLLLAGTFASLPRRTGRVACSLLLAVQAAALAGLMIRPETMQPARATAIAAASLAQGGVVLLPRGNDGVGIVGAFAIEAPLALPLMVVGKDATAAHIRAQLTTHQRVVLALLGQDADSRATLLVMRQALADRCWRPAGEGFNVLAFERVCDEACLSSSFQRRRE